MMHQIIQLDLRKGELIFVFKLLLQILSDVKMGVNFSQTYIKGGTGVRLEGGSLPPSNHPSN